MSWQEVKRTKKGKGYQSTDDPSKFAVDAGLVRLHYSTEYGAETYDNEINFTPERITVGGYDGWRVNAAPWSYYLGQYPNNLGDGWVGFGGRRGQHALWFRLLRVGFLRWSDRDWWDIGGAPTYDRANLTRTVTTTTLPTTGESVPTGLIAKWSNLWATPGGGTIGAEWRADGNRLKEDITLNQAGRTWIKNNRNPLTHWPGSSLDDIYFGYVFAIDPADIPRWVKQGVLQDIEGDFDDDGGQSGITLENALHEFLAFLPADDAIVQAGRVTTRLRLRKRIYQQDGNYYLLVGARADLLNSMPDGDLVFDPTIEEEVGASADDAEQWGDGTMHLTDYTIDVWGTAPYAGVRFQGVALDGTETITSNTYLSLYLVDGYTAVDLDITGDDVDDAAAFTSAANNISGRTDTTALVAWSVSGSNNAYNNSPDISSIIAEIIARGGWGTGNDIALILHDGGACDISFDAYDSGSGNYAILHTEYTSGAADLTVADASVTSQVDAVTLTVTYNLAVADASVVSQSDAPTLTGVHNLTVNDASITTQADAVALTVTYNLVVADASVTTQADNVTLTGVQNITVADASVVSQVDAVTLTGAHNLTVADASVTTQVDAVVISSSVLLTVQDTSVTTQADIVTLTGAHNLTVADASVTAQADAITLTGVHNLTIQDASVTTQADNVILAAADTLSIQSVSVTTQADNVTLTGIHNLSVDDAFVTTQADNISLAGAITLTVQDASVTAQVDTLALTAQHNLTLADAHVTTQADSIALTQVHVLVVQDSYSVSELDLFALTGAHTIIVEDAYVVDVLDNVIVVMSDSTVATWTLRDRDTAWSLEDRDTAWSLRGRDIEWSIEER